MKRARKFIQFTISFLLFFLIISCSGEADKVIESQQKTVTALPVQDTLNAQTVSLDGETELLSPFRILNVDDTYMVISSGERANNFIHVFDLPDLAFLYDWGRKGRGPNEFMMAPRYIDVDDRRLIMLDNLAQIVKTFEVSDSSLTKAEEFTLTYDEQRSPLNRMRRMNDSLYFAEYGWNMPSVEEEYMALKPDFNDTLFTFGEYPSNEEENAEHFVYSKSNIKNPEGTRFAGFYFNYNRFKVFNNSGELLRDIEVSDPHIADTLTANGDIIYRGAAWASNTYIYCLGFYANNDDIWDNPDANIRTSLEVWSWEGEHVYRAAFDRLINGITVSEKYKKVYGFSSHTANELYIFDIGGISLVE